MKDTVDPHIQISDIDKIFGWDTPDNIISRVIFTAIQTIYQKRQSGNRYGLFDVKRLLANQMMLEESLAIIRNRETQFEKTWGSVYIDLSAI